MRSFTLLLLACSLAAAACGNPNGLTAYISNTTDTVTLYALSGTPVVLPSGYSIPSRSPVRTDAASTFDFAFDIDTAGRALLLPTGALKMGQQSGLQRSTQKFDSIKYAPTGGYNLDSAQVLNDSTVLIAHSTLVTCSFGVSTYYYAKLHVLAIDTTSGPNGRRLKFVILVDLNCGFRGLQEGLPRN
jgi:hypothetical protein